MKVSLSRAMTAHLRGIRELYKITPGLFPSMIASAAATALIPYAGVYFSAQILRELTLLRRPEILWKWVTLGVVCTGILAVCKALLRQRLETLTDDVWGRKEILFCRKMFSLDFADIDKQETHDLRAQIQQMENWSGYGLARVTGYFEQALYGIFGILSGIALTVGLFTSPVPEGAGALTWLNHPVFVLLFGGVILLISFLAGRLYGKISQIWSSAGESATFGNRLFGFFGFIGTKRGRNVDIRMYDQQKLAASYFSFDVIPFSTNGILGRLDRGAAGVYFGLASCITTLTTGFVYLFTCLKALGGAFDIGSVTQYVGAATALAANVYGLLEVMGGIKTNTPYLENTFQFLDIPNSMYQGSLTTEKRADRQYEVEFRDVSFKYPGSELWALRHVNIKFKVGKRLAIVGENGSGKTTFIKLLCRLYDPQEGQILLNGIDIRKYNYRDYMNIFSVVFQDFQLISQPLGANVAGSSTYDEEKVRKALVDAGFGDRLESLPDGLNTQLYKDFTENGIEVSGGEAQKIAIARALYKDAPFIILDEPTAALDPIAEAEIYAKFNDISGDKTAVYISHRLSSCKFCDEIAVFHDGQVIQQGTHDQLLADPAGKYHALWHAQAQYYTEPADG